MDDAGTSVANDKGTKMFCAGEPTGAVGPGSRGVSSGQRSPAVLVTPGKSAGSRVIPPPGGRPVKMVYARVSSMNCIQ